MINIGLFQVKKKCNISKIHITWEIWETSDEKKENWYRGAVSH